MLRQQPKVLLRANAPPWHPAIACAADRAINLTPRGTRPPLSPPRALCRKLPEPEGEPQAYIERSLESRWLALVTLFKEGLSLCPSVPGLPALTEALGWCAALAWHRRADRRGRLWRVMFWRTRHAEPLGRGRGLTPPRRPLAPVRCGLGSRKHRARPWPLRPSPPRSACWARWCNRPPRRCRAGWLHRDRRSRSRRTC